MFDQMSKKPVCFIVIMLALTPGSVIANDTTAE